MSPHPATIKKLACFQTSRAQSYNLHQLTLNTSAIFFAVSTGIFLAPFSYLHIQAPETPTRSASSLMQSFLFLLNFVRLLIFSNGFSFPRLHCYYIMKQKYNQEFLPFWYLHLLLFVVYCSCEQHCRDRILRLETLCHRFDSCPPDYSGGSSVGRAKVCKAGFAYCLFALR